MTVQVHCDIHYTYLYGRSDAILKSDEIFSCADPFVTCNIPEHEIQYCEKKNQHSDDKYYHC